LQLLDLEFGLQTAGLGHELGLETAGLETAGLGLGLGLETAGLGLALETAGLGLGLETAGLGLGLGLETAGLGLVKLLDLDSELGRFVTKSLCTFAVFCLGIQPATLILIIEPTSRNTPTT